MADKYAINEKPFLLMMKMPGVDSWYYMRLARAEFALHEVKRAKPIEWTVVRDIRMTFWDFHNPELTEKMKADAYQFGTWLAYAEPSKGI